jgi:hypothetical protein
MASALLVPLPLCAGAANSQLAISVVVSRSCLVETAVSATAPRVRLQCAAGASRNLRTTAESYNSDRQRRPAEMSTSITAPDARADWRVLTLNF